MIFQSTLKKLLLGISLLISASAFSATINLDLTNLDSAGFYGDDGNAVVLVDLGANSRLTGISYSVNLTAFDPSWLADMWVSFEPADFAASGYYYFNPGFEIMGPGTASYSGSIDLADVIPEFRVGSDGLLRLEFYESFNDLPGVEGIWNFANFILEIEPGPSPVPEPASTLLLGAGLAAMRRASIRYRLNKASAWKLH